MPSLDLDGTLQHRRGHRRGNCQPSREVSMSDSIEEKERDVRERTLICDL
jgi:hypothetical protein